MFTTTETKNGSRFKGENESEEVTRRWTTRTASLSDLRYPLPRKDLMQQRAPLYRKRLLSGADFGKDEER